MCFIIIPGQHERTAKSDIPCFKVLRVVSYGLLAPYTNHAYHVQGVGNKLGQEMTSDLVPEYQGETAKLMVNNSISTGLHSYSTRNKARTCLSSLRVAGNKFRIYPIPKFRIYQATIPKDARYYHDPESEVYVSDRLVVSPRRKQLMETWDSVLTMLSFHRD